MKLPVQILLTSILLFLTACSSNTPVAVVTIPATQIGAGAPVYTATASFTPSSTPTHTPTPTQTSTATATFTPLPTHTPSVTPTATDTATPIPTPTASPTETPVLVAPTQINLEGAPAEVAINPAPFSDTAGWSCGDFPCEEDIDNFLDRIQVPDGFTLDHVGQFPDQVVQITYGPDERLYATVLENGTQRGAVYVLNDNGTPERYSETIVSPSGLAFQPGTSVLYVAGRKTLEEGGALYRVDANSTELVIGDLPCCFQNIRNQPSGVAFGSDGLLYMSIGSLTDRAESPNPASQPFAEVLPDEAAILKINPHTKEVMPYAAGLHYPFDITFDSNGRLFATDIGLLTGEGDRLLQINQDDHYGWPYYRTRGCSDCPSLPGTLDVTTDLLTLPNYTIPHGLVAYTGTQFPENMQDTLFVTLWNGTSWGQRVVWVDPDDLRLTSDEYELQPFITGLTRPTDVIVAPDGSIVVADFIYGHVWRVSYTGGAGFELPVTTTQSSGFVLPTNTPQN